MKREPKNIVASVQARLLQRSQDLDVEHQLTLARFGGERLLYHLSKSAFADRFILKGAALLLLWLGEAIRPTDIDLLGLGDTSAEALKRIFIALCETDAPEDGLTFVADTVRVEAIRERQEYGGMRITLKAMLGNVRIPLQVDIGAGDVVVPPPDIIDYPGSARPSACSPTCLQTGDVDRREDRGAGPSRTGEQPDEGLFRYSWPRHDQAIRR